MEKMGLVNTEKSRNIRSHISEFEPQITQFYVQIPPYTNLEKLVK